MIDWPTTEEQLGVIDLSSYRPKVIVKCDQCGKQATFTIRVKSRLINNQLNWMCIKCACNKKEIKEIHSQQMTKQWEKEEYKEQRKESSIELWRKDRQKIMDGIKRNPKYKLSVNHLIYQR